MVSNIDRVKIGKGDDYSSLSGFTFPDGENPRRYQKNARVNMRQNDYPMREDNFSYDMGLQDTEVSLSGRLSSAEDYEDLKREVMSGRYLYYSDGRVEVDMYYKKKLYLYTDWFLFVKRGSFNERLSGSSPGLYSYELSFMLASNFYYSDSYEEVEDSGSSGTTDSLDFGDSEVYQIPFIEIEAVDAIENISINPSNEPGGITASLGDAVSEGDKIEIDLIGDIILIYDSDGNLKNNRLGFGGRLYMAPGVSDSFEYDFDGKTGDIKIRSRTRRL